MLIEDGKITEVGPRLRARDAEIVDAAGTVVMPGFIDTHRHAWRSLQRNAGVLGDGGHQSVVGWQPEDVYAGTLIGLLGAVEAGITTVVDWSDTQVDPRFAEPVVQAHNDSGVRTVLIPMTPQETGSTFAPGLRDRGGNTVVAFGSDDPGRGGSEEVGDRWSEARSSGLRIHAHAGRRSADAGAVAVLAGLDLLGEDVTLVHCSKLGAEDLDAIAASRTRVALTPSTEMAGGLGAPPIQDLMDRDIRPGLGVDDERVSPGDLFAQMRAAIAMQHATRFDLKLAGKAGLPKLMSTRDVIRYATADGAAAAGLDALTGSIEPGKQADVIVLRADRPNIFPINDPIGAVVWGMDTSNLDWVFVGGRALMRHGVLEGDIGRARSLATQALTRIGNAGVPAPAGTKGDL